MKEKPEPLTWELLDCVGQALGRLASAARRSGDHALNRLCIYVRRRLTHQKRIMAPLVHNCWNCASPHCRHLNGMTVFCYGHPDAEDHAHETRDATHNVCPNWRGKAKRLGCCRYSYRCELNHDGRCGLKTWCKYQGGTPR